MFANLPGSINGNASSACCQPLNSIVRSMANAQHPGPYPSVTPLQLLLKLQQVELHFLCFIHLQASIPKLTVGKFGVNNVNETWLNFRAFRTVSTGACNVVASRLLLSGAQVLDGAIISGSLTCQTCCNGKMSRDNVGYFILVTSSIWSMMLVKSSFSKLLDITSRKFHTVSLRLFLVSWSWYWLHDIGYISDCLACIHHPL